MRAPSVRHPMVLAPLRSAVPYIAPLGVAAAYYVGAEIAFYIGTLTQMFAPFWPPNVVLLCALLVVPERRWWKYVAAVFPAHVIAELGVGMPVPQLLMAFICNAAVAILTAVAMRRILGGPPWLDTAHKASLYLLVAVLCPALVGLVGGFEPMLGDGLLEDYWLFWWRWSLCNVLGSLTLTPLFLTWFAEPGAWRKFVTEPWSFEAIAIALGLLLVCTVAFGAPIEAVGADFLPALLYAPIPVIFAAAVRFGGKGASGAVIVVTVLAIWYAMQGHGPFADGGPGQTVLPLQLFLAVISAPVILIAALVEELRRTNRDLASVLDGISDGYLTVNAEGRLTAVNGRAAAWLGRGPPTALLGSDFWALHSPVAASIPVIRRALQTGRPAHAEVPSDMHPGRWVELHVYPAGDGVSAFFRDVTPRQEALDALRRSEEKFREMAETVPASLLTSTPDHGCDYVSPRFGEYTGFSAAQTQGFGWVDAIHPDDRGTVLAARTRAVESGEMFDAECRLRAADGSYRWFAVRWRPARDAEGKVARLFGAVTDIDALKQSEEALRGLTVELLRAQDDERRRIARELHDSTAQNLLGAFLGIDQALRATPEPAGAREATLKQSQALIEQSQREIRTLAYLLHPPVLDGGGLPAALRWLVDGFSSRTEIQVDLDVRGDIARPEAGVELALFRVAQEALTNVHRHSGSAWARVSLATGGTRGKPQLSLSIEDRGKGMPDELMDPGGRTVRIGGPAPGMGVGLIGMRERVRQLGGELTVTSGLKGTVIQAKVPAGRSG